MIMRPRQGRRRHGPPAAARAPRRRHPGLHRASRSDRGLCGGYNTHVIRMAEREINAARGRRRAVLASFVVGKKAQSYFRFRGYDIDDAFLGVTDQPTYEQAREIGRGHPPAASRRASSLSVDIIYWRFITRRHPGGGRPPLPARSQTEELGDAADSGPSADLEYEPSPTGILNELLPRYVESRIYSALLDASASEYAARQRAMKAATDNAEELKTTLSRIMNRARQDAITTEIMEIVGGAEALGADKGSQGRPHAELPAARAPLRPAPRSHRPRPSAH